MTDKDIKVLVVDDDGDLREILVSNLDLEGFTVYEAAGGIAALQFLKENKIDFVLSDIRMPAGDGMELLREIRKIDPNIPVVCLITGFSDSTKEDVLKLGGIDLLGKPPDMDLIYKYIRESVKRNKL